MLYQEGKEGKKRIGEDMRDLVENAFGLPRGQLDEAESAIAERNGLLQGAQENDATAPALESDSPIVPDAPAHQPSAATLADVTSQATTLERLTADEKHIIELYRRATPDGRLMIFGAATVAPKDSASDHGFTRLK